MKKSTTQIDRGKTISFRIPSDTPDYILKELQRLKETERRNFSSKMAEFVLKGVNESTSKERETITIPLPNRLTKAQRDWVKHEHSEALLGSIVYQLLNDPVRATAILSSLNSQSTDLDEALYLQDEEVEPSTSNEKESHYDDLNDIDWEDMIPDRLSKDEETSEEDVDLDDLLGDFLDKMNK